MALWRWRTGRWEKVRALPPYLPPEYLRIRLGELGEKVLWRIETVEWPPYGADRLDEALEALLSACRRPRGEGGIWVLEAGSPPRRVERIEPFSPEALWDKGLLMKRLARPPDKWLLLLQLARPVQGLFISRWERYIASWRPALEALLAAVLEGGPA